MHPARTLNAQAPRSKPGSATTITDSSSGLGDDSSQDIELTIELASWTSTLATEPGPTLLRLYTTGESMYFTPDRAGQLATELTHLAEAAELRAPPTAETVLWLEGGG